MKVGIVSDIHGNLHALEAVEKVLIQEKVEEVWCLGDVVGYSPFPNECLEWVKENATRFVLGNHELAVLGFLDLSLVNEYAREGILWSKRVLKEELKEYLLNVKISDIFGKFQLVHDTPESPGSMKYILNGEDAYYALLSQQGDVCFFGHTHLPAAYSMCGGEVEEIDTKEPLFLDLGKFLLNPGSVGQPRDNDPRASFIIMEDDTVVRWLKVEYDTKSAAKEILKAGLPEFLAARLILGV